MTHVNNPPYADLSTLQDSFAGPLSPEKWHVYPGSDITENVNGKLLFFNNGNRSRMDSVHLYEFDLASVKAESNYASGARYLSMNVMGIEASNPDAGYQPELLFIVRDDELTIKVQNYMTSILDSDVQLESTGPYNPVAHAYWRITAEIRQPDNLPRYIFYTSPDGATWNRRAQFDALGELMDPISAWRVGFYADAGVAYLSNFNAVATALKIRTTSGTWVNASPGALRLRGPNGQWVTGGPLMLRTPAGTWTLIAS